MDKVKQVITDSNGNQLSDQQIKYFKDSKIRDNNGHLLVMNHGTPRGHFEDFDTSIPNFFTVDYDYAFEYSEPREDGRDTISRVYVCYLNITKPFDLSTQQQVDLLKGQQFNQWLEKNNLPPIDQKLIVKGKPVYFTIADVLYPFLKQNYNTLGYDGIICSEGVGYSKKYADDVISVIPLFANQVKYIDNVSPTNNNRLDERKNIKEDTAFNLNSSLQETLINPVIVDEQDIEASYGDYLKMPSSIYQRKYCRNRRDELKRQTMYIGSVEQGQQWDIDYRVDDKRKILVYDRYPFSKKTEYTLIDENIIEEKNNMEKIREASYGGAFDIADDQYFTREDLDSLIEYVEEELSDLGAHVIDGEINVVDGHNVVRLETEWKDYVQEVTDGIDMRKIKLPHDLITKYGKHFANLLRDKIESDKADFEAAEAINAHEREVGWEGNREDDNFGEGLLLPDINLKLDAHNFGGNNNDVSVLGEELYRDREGCFDAPGAELTIDQLKAIYDKDHDNDPVIGQYDSFELWMEDNITNGYLEKVEVEDESILPVALGALGGLAVGSLLKEDTPSSHYIYKGGEVPSDIKELIKTAEVENGVTSIDYGAFYDCTGLTSITIPNSVASIGSFAFYKCTRLTSVTIPNSIERIGNFAFYGCTKLTNITIPNSVKSIGNWAFNRCDSLRTVHYKGTEKQWNDIEIGKVNDILYYCDIIFEKEEDKTDEGLIGGDINLDLDLHDFGGSGNVVGVGNKSLPGLGEDAIGSNSVGTSSIDCVAKDIISLNDDNKKLDEDEDEDPHYGERARAKTNRRWEVIRAHAAKYDPSKETEKRRKAYQAVENDPNEEIFLLSVDEYYEYEDFFSDIHKEWWLRSPGHSSNLAAHVFGIGSSVNEWGSNVNNNYIGARPALRSKFFSPYDIGDKVNYLGNEWVVIDDGLAISKYIIGYPRFDKDSNNYETSEIKKYIEDWYNKRKNWNNAQDKEVTDGESFSDTYLDESTDEDSRYVKIKSKSVEDSDGFLTDYTMYYDNEENRYVFVFGDSDLYRPEDEEFDWEAESREAADEWFDSYTGFEDEEDEWDYNESLKESYQPEYENDVKFRDPKKQLLADFINDRLYDAFDNFYPVVNAKLGLDLDSDENMSPETTRCWNDLVKSMTNEMFGK